MWPARALQLPSRVIFVQDLRLRNFQIRAVPARSVSILSGREPAHTRPETFRRDFRFTEVSNNGGADVSFTNWLTEQVEELEKEIRAKRIVERAEPPSPTEIVEIRRLVAVHRFLVQELARREERKNQEVLVKSARVA